MEEWQGRSLPGRKVHPHLPALPFSAEAEQYFREYGVSIEVKDPTSTRGGGLWYPAERRVVLETAQAEAAIHELAHAWWEERRRDVATRQGLMAAVERLAEEKDPHYARAARLAYVYRHGDPGTGFPGMGDNDWETYAGLASGVMGDIELLPDYVKPYYRRLFVEPPTAAGA